MVSSFRIGWFVMSVAPLLDVSIVPWGSDIATGTGGLSDRHAIVQIDVSTGDGGKAMVMERVTRADLGWWLDFAAGLEWTFARTYADTAPHDYVVQGRTPGVTHADVVRAARVIGTFGVPGKFYSTTKLYLTSPDGQFRWWCEDTHFTDATLVNRAGTDLLYGVQNAPSTVSGIETPWDEVATAWDEHHPAAVGEKDDLRELLAPHRGPYPPHVLDLGCGTGRLLDLGVVSPETYAGVDWSQAMLNVLVRKHPRVAAIYPMDVADALAAGLFTPGQFDWVFMDAEVDLGSEALAQVYRIARRTVIRVDGDEWDVSSPIAERE